MRAWRWNENLSIETRKRKTEIRIFPPFFFCLASSSSSFSLLLFFFKKKKKKRKTVGGGLRFQWERIGLEKGSDAKFKTRQWRRKKGKQGRLAQDPGRGSQSITTTNQRPPSPWKRRDRKKAITPCGIKQSRDVGSVFILFLFVLFHSFGRINVKFFLFQFFYLNLSSDTDFCKMNCKPLNHLSAISFLRVGGETGRVQGREKTGGLISNSWFMDHFNIYYYAIFNGFCFERMSVCLIRTKPDWP